MHFFIKAILKRETGAKVLSKTRKTLKKLEFGTSEGVFTTIISLFFKKIYWVRKSKFLCKDTKLKTNLKYKGTVTPKMCCSKPKKPQPTPAIGFVLILQNSGSEKRF